MRKHTKDPSVCALEFALKRVSGKYKGRILWYLDHKGTLRYGELGRLINDSTPKMLTQTLRELEEDGLINRKMYHEVPPKVEYSLTDKGHELIPFFRYLSNWGSQQIDQDKLKDPIVLD